jgi:2-keto-3-deoxy-L-rhamnonate aldolase RhmA
MNKMTNFYHELEFKKKVRNGECVYGTFLHEINSTCVVKVLDESGFDFYVIDCEHGPFTYDDVSTLSAASDYGSMLPMVRVAELRKETVQKVLEAGAASLMIPAARTAADAREAVRLSKYRPEGERGFATFYPFSNYSTVHSSEILKKANEALSVILQIETRQAVECIDEIAGVKGIDALLVGPNDLALSYDMPGQSTDPFIVSIIEKVVKTARLNGIGAGMHCGSPEEAAFWKERGVNIITWSTPTMMIYNSGREFLSAVGSGKFRK